MIRKFLYRIKLIREHGREDEITIATVDKSRLPELIERNRVFFELGAAGKIASWKFINELNTLGLPDGKYDEEVAFADIDDTISDDVI